MSDLLAKIEQPENTESMKRHYEGSIAELESDDWSEPCDVYAATEKIAGQLVINAHMEADELEHDKEVRVCVREITVDGDPIGEWCYFTGLGWRICRSIIKDIPIANEQVDAPAHD